MHADGVPYMDYIRRIAADPIARAVKIADLKHNMDTRRVDGVKTARYPVYLEALAYLESIKED